LLRVFDWTALLRVAERLLTEASDEASLRSAINRAYYAAYHTAAAFVRASGRLRQGHTHRRVWSILVEDRDPGWAAIGRRGDQLRETRIMADYRGNAPNNLAAVARHSVDEARSLVDAINRLR
jgi:uncharacterized protein (UPF0332 family)